MLRSYSYDDLCVCFWWSADVRGLQEGAGTDGSYLLMIDTYTSMMCDRGRSGVVLCIIFLYDEWYIPTTNVYL